jgi:hypothetical protein
MSGCLSGEGFGEHLFRQDFAEVEQQVFDVGQFGSPGRPLRAIELLDQVFGHALDIGTYIFYQRRALLGIRHP